MCPTDMQPYIKAHELEQDEKDTYVHVAAYRYGVDVLTYSLDHILNGNKAKSTINEQSIRQQLHEKQEEDKPLTEEDIKRETELYFRQRRIEKLNFDLAQIQKSEG